MVIVVSFLTIIFVINNLVSIVFSVWILPERPKKTVDNLLTVVNAGNIPGHNGVDT